MPSHTKCRDAVESFLRVIFFIDGRSYFMCEIWIIIGVFVDSPEREIDTIVIVIVLHRNLIEARNKTIRTNSDGKKFFLVFRSFLRLSIASSQVKYASSPAQDGSSLLSHSGEDNRRHFDAQCWSMQPAARLIVKESVETYALQKVMDSADEFRSDEFRSDEFRSDELRLVHCN